MNAIRLAGLGLLVLVASGCSTYAVPRYTNSADNVTALRSLRGQEINVGTFSATKPGVNQISCRAVGPIKTPDGNSFEDFIRNALVAELKLAEVYSANAPVTLTGNVDQIDFSSASGNWDIRLTVTSSNGRSISVAEAYRFTSSFYGETACNQTAQAMMPAVQNVISKLVSHPEFGALVGL
ncbi:MAG TPA: hypothetical protein VJ011_05955 [Steroidobacteraceae bacterium]|nr:hypothetical protein [Steroidobacteraceae bacterium]